MRQFETLRASTLYCRKCKATMEVRERLLLVLPDKELYDYLCVGCGESLGSREVTAGEIERMRRRPSRPSRMMPPGDRAMRGANRPPRG